MNKYELYLTLKQTIPRKINNFELYLLLFDFKLSFTQQHDFAKFKELNNSFCIRLIVEMLYEQSSRVKENLNNILGRINKNNLFREFIMDSTQLLHKKEEERLDNLLKSFVASGLIKNAKVIDQEKQPVIEITLLSDKKIKYSHMVLEDYLIDEYRGNCHFVVSGFMRRLEMKNVRVAVCLVDNELYGKYYHSFIVVNDVVFDLSHDILMNYNDYIELFNPQILVLEDADKVEEKIKELELNKAFTKTKYVDILKYAIEKQLQGKGKVR